MVPVPGNPPIQGPFQTVEQIELALEVAPSRMRLGLVYQEYCLLRLEAEGRTWPRYDLPFGDQHWHRFIAATPTLIVLEWCFFWPAALSRLWYNWWVFPGFSLLLGSALAILFLSLIAYRSRETFGTRGRAARRIRRAANADSESRAKLLAEALRLELEQA